MSERSRPVGVDAVAEQKRAHGDALGGLGRGNGHKLGRGVGHDAFIARGGRRPNPARGQLHAVSLKPYEKKPTSGCAR